MRTLIGLLLMVGGAIIILGGFAYAMMAFAGMYQHALENAMADGNEQAVAGKMWNGAIFGVVGVPFFVIGSFLTGRGVLARWLGKPKS